MSKIIKKSKVATDRNFFHPNNSFKTGYLKALISLFTSLFVVFIVFAASSKISMQNSISPNAPESEPKAFDSDNENLGIVRACVVPSGNYYTKFSVDSKISWSLKCEGGYSKNGIIALNEQFNFGNLNLPYSVRVGNKINKTVNLSSICKDLVNTSDLNNLCSICKSVNCNNIKATVSANITKSSCGKDLYSLSGVGQIQFSGSAKYDSNSCFVTGVTKGNVKTILQSLL